jgi:8-oxo-dGTP pyrophosphatase MutT (NUDIX family)
VPGQRFTPSEISAGGVLVRRSAGGQPEVCLVNDGRYWGLPKGNLEPGESALQAAVREVSEETGIPAQDLSLVAPLPASEYAYRRQGRLIFKRVEFFLFAVPADRELHPQPEEISEARWVTFADGRALASFKDTVRALDESARLLDTDGVVSR